MAQQFATDYIDVATRLAEFRAKYPEGSLQPADLAQPFQVVEVGGKTRLIVVAAAYRHPEDLRPGIGMAYEEVPGRTPYTRDSELQNAETSAWGRAIVAALAADTKKGIASAEEVRNRQADREVPEKKAERIKKPAQPVVDQWTEPEGAEPPTPPSSKKTDEPWFDDWLRRVVACDSLDDLKTLWSECTEKHRFGKLTDADFEQAVEAKNGQKAAIERATDPQWPAVKQPGSGTAA